MLAFLPENAFAARCGYAVADEFGYALNCHCSNCRRTTGAAFKPFAGIARDKFSVTRGEDDLMIYGDEAGHDAHCRKCGSLLYSVVREGAFVHVAMGTLVDDPSIRPTAHIFVGSKASWFSITDDLPQYGSMSCRVERLTLREYTARRRSSISWTEPAERLIGHGRTDGALARLRIRRWCDSHPRGS